MPNYLLKAPFRMVLFNLDNGSIKKYTKTGVYFAGALANDIVVEFNNYALYRYYPGNTELLNMKCYGNEKGEPFVYIKCEFKDFITKKEFKQFVKWLTSEFREGWGKQLSDKPVGSYSFLEPTDNNIDLFEEDYLDDELYHMAVEDFYNRLSCCCVNVFAELVWKGSPKCDIQLVEQVDTYFKP